MKRRILSFVLSIFMLLSFVPNFVYAQETHGAYNAQEVKNKGEELESKIVRGEDDKVYTAFSLDGYTAGDILGYGMRVMAVGDEILTHTLELTWVGRTYEEFPFPDEGIELRLAPKSDVNKIIATITYTKDDIYQKTETMPDGTVHLVGRAKRAKPFTQTKDFTQDLLDEGVDMLIPYGISFHPELFVYTGGTSSFRLNCSQKANPLWTAEWNVSNTYANENKKPNIFAFYYDKGNGDESAFELPKNDNVYSMQGTTPQGMYWDGANTINIWDKSNPNLHKVIVGQAAKINRNKDYRGKLIDDAFLLVSSAAQPRPFTGFGEGFADANKTGFYRADENSPKFLLNTYPSADKINTPNEKVKVPASSGKYLEGKEIPAYRALKRYAVYESLNVKFNTGNGFLNEADKNAKKKEQNINVTLTDEQIKAQTIEDSDYVDGKKDEKLVKAQTIGYNEKINDNESGRKITVPDGSTLIPPEADAGKPANEFKGWALTADAQTALFKTQDEADAYAKPFTDSTTTFYAIFGPKAQGKVNVEYKDASNNAINDKYKLDGEQYPTELFGDKGTAIKAEHTSKAPKFLGYEFKQVATNPVPTPPNSATYDDPAKYTLIYKYEKLADIIPEKGDDGNDNPDATDDVKNTYKKVTIKVDGEKGKFQKNNNDVAGTEFVYYVNPVEGKTLQDVLTESGLTAMSKDKNANKIDANKPWTFDPAKTAEQTPADVALATEVSKTNFTGDVTMEVNFGQTTAEQFKNKLKPVDIKVWVDPTDADGKKINWKKGVALKNADTALQAILDDAQTVVTDLGENGTKDAPQTSRNSSIQNLPDGKKGNLLVAFGDGSSLVVNDQMLYVAEHKVTVKPDEPNQVNPEKLPDDKVAVEFKLGEGVKIGDKNGNTTPVLYETIYVKPTTSLEAGDIPETTLQDNYKNNKWYNGADELAAADYTNITNAKEFIAKAVLKGQGTVNVEYWADGAKIDDISELRLAGKTYITSKSGKEDAEVNANEFTNDYNDLIGYEKDTTKGTNGIEVPADAKYLTTNQATVKFHYKKIDDIIGPVNPGDTKPEGYVTVTFKDIDNAKLDDTDKDVVYYVNPKAKTKAKITIDSGVYTIFGTKANGSEFKKETPAVTAENNFAIEYAKGSNGKWAYDNFDKVEKDITSDVTFTPQVKGSVAVKYVFKDQDGNVISDNMLPGVRPQEPSARYKEGESVNAPTEPKTGTIKPVFNAQGEIIGTWTFEGWDKNQQTSDGKNDIVFVGTWKKWVPEAKDINVRIDEKPNPKDGIKNPADAPKDTDYEFEEEPNTKDPGTKDATIIINVPRDGQDNIVIKVKTKVNVSDKKNIDVEYPTSEIYVGDYKMVEPEIYGTPTTETDEAPYVINRRQLEDMDVTVKAHSDGRLTIEIGENYNGPKRFTIYLDVVVDGQAISTYADVIVLEAENRRPEAAVKTDDREIHEHSAYIFGYPDGSVRPQGNITRAEAAAMIARLLNIEAMGSNTKPMFPDTPSAWYNRAINAVVQRGIMKGYPDGSFKPNNPITRAEFTTMIAAIDNKAYGVAPFADVMGHWAENAIGREYQAGRITGYPDGTFRPQRYITRAEAATILNKIFDRCYDAMSLLETKNKENVRIFTDLYQNFWAYNDMVEATNNHSFKRRDEQKGIQEDWVEVK